MCHSEHERGLRILVPLTLRRLILHVAEPLIIVTLLSLGDFVCESTSTKAFHLIQYTSRWLCLTCHCNPLLVPVPTSSTAESACHNTSISTHWASVTTQCGDAEHGSSRTHPLCMCARLVTKHWQQHC